MIEFLCAAVGSVLGLVVGYFVAGRNRSGKIEEPLAAPESGQTEEMRSMLAHLRSIACSVAAGVDVHQVKVEQVNKKLSSEGASSGVMGQAIAALLEANQAMQRELQEAQSRIAKQAEAIETVTAQARTDALTGVANRLAFNEYLSNSFNEFTHEGRTTTLVLMDIDFFKKINDTYGHAAGDHVLKVVAKRLSDRLQGRGVVARYGGEEFALLFPGCPAPWMFSVAEVARCCVGAEPIQFEKQIIPVTCSAGLADFQQGSTPESLIERADEGLYKSKREGRNRGYWHSGSEWLPMAEALESMQWTPVEAESNPVHQAEPAIAAKVAPQPVPSPAPLVAPAPVADVEDSEVASIRQLTEECLEVGRDATAGPSGVLDLNKLKDSQDSSELPLNPSDVPELLNSPAAFRQTVSMGEFRNRMESAGRQLATVNLPMSVLIIRLRESKKLLERFGAESMDECMELVVRTAHCCIRPIDLVGNAGEDRLCILLPGCNLEVALQRAVRIQSTLHVACEGADEEHLSNLTIDAVATVSHGSESAGDLMERAVESMDNAMSGPKPFLLAHDGERLMEKSKLLTLP